MRDKSLIDENGEVAELDDTFFKRATRGRPPLPKENRKQRVTMMLDQSIIAHFKKDGKGWQTRVNAALVELIK